VKVESKLIVIAAAAGETYPPPHPACRPAAYGCTTHCMCFGLLGDKLLLN
jgi:hypothetical protein